MTSAADPADKPDFRSWLLRELPYVAMLAFGLGGIVLTSFRGATMYDYWMALAPIYGVITVIAGWPKVDTGRMRTQLVVRQALHWLAFIAAMWLMFRPEVRGIVNDNATSLCLLLLLALGTFVAGVHAGAWRICAVGIFLALSLPAVAWIQDSSVLILVGALLLAAVAFAFWWMWRREIKRL
jgi:hypothetical protein